MDDIDQLGLGMAFNELENEQASSKTKYSNIIHRYADNFNDFNSASTVRFEMRLIGLSPGKHDLLCLVSKIDETMNENNIQSQTTPPFVAYKKVIEVKDYLNEDISNEQKYSYKNISNWFDRAGYIDLYAIFDLGYLDNYIKNNKKNIPTITIDWNYLQTWMGGTKDNKPKGQNENKEDGFVIETLKKVKGFVKNIINGNFISKKELDSVLNTLANTLSSESLTLDGLKHLQLKTFSLLDLASNLTTLSIVPIDVLSNNVFKYYKLWSSLKQTVTGIMSTKSLLYKDNASLLKDLLFKQLKLYIIFQKTALNGKRKIIVDNCVEEIGKIMGKLFDCHKVEGNIGKEKEDEQHVFKTCQGNSIDITTLWEKYIGKLMNKTVNEVLDVEIEQEMKLMV